MVIKLSLILTILLNIFIPANSDCFYSLDKRITVVGIALNDKDAAFVRTNNGKHYIVDGLDEWDEKYYSKTVKVTGKLKTETHSKESTDSVAVQERLGTWYILKKPKWSLYKSD